ncbi:hypothetical protein NKDENANG_03266 [Candidatus Entotheonellaceae bacterium PAL068K]
MKSAMTLLGVLVAGYLVLSGLMYALQEHFLFYPEVLPQSYVFRFSFSVQPEEVWLETPQACVHGLYFRAAPAKGVVLYFHGNTGSVREWGTVAPDFLQLGYSILIMDYRGYGKSTGKLSQQALLEDAQLAYEALKQHYPESAITVFGRSLGGGPAAYLAARNHPARLVLETPYRSMQQLAKEYYAWLPIRLLLKYPLPVEHYLLEVQCPVYIVHGTADRVIPISHSRSLQQQLSLQGKHYLEIPGGDHNDLQTYEAYHQWLARLFE